LNSNFYNNSQNSSKEIETDETRIQREHPLTEETSEVQNYANESDLVEEILHHEFEDLLGEYVEGNEIINQNTNQDSISVAMQAASNFSATHTSAVNVEDTGSLPSFHNMKTYESQLLDPQNLTPHEYEGTANFIKYKQSSTVKVNNYFILKNIQQLYSHPHVLRLLKQIKMLSEYYTPVPWRDSKLLGKSREIFLLQPFDSISNVSLAFCLNYWQHYVFEYYARHLLYAYTLDIVDNTNTIVFDTTFPSSLRRQVIGYMGGNAGTGKSAVIEALLKFSVLWGRRDTIETMAFMGLAGLMIEGDSIHSSRGMSVGQSATYSQPRTLKVKKVYLSIVDETSQAPQVVMGEASLETRKIRCNNLPWGGIHLLLSGDFLQNPPIQSNYIFQPADDSTRQYFKVMAALDIWNNINFKAFLIDPMRQAEDSQFVDILDRVHWGVTTEDDVAVLNGRYLPNLPAMPIIPSEPEVFTPMGTSLNRDRHAFSTCTIIQNALVKKVPLFEILAYSEDRRNRKIIERLKHLNDNDTQKIPFLIRFIIGKLNRF